MYEELMQLASELRQATDRLLDTMDRPATTGGDWVDAIDYDLNRQNFAGLVQFYEKHSEVPYGLDQPFLWQLKVELAGGAVVEYGDLFSRLGGLLDEQSMMDAGA
jgi:hypothetical protein